MNNYRQSIITELSSFHEDIIINNIKISGINNINTSLSTHYIIYEILNINNGKYYIGQHETKNPCDKYMGSGHFLQSAKNKEGLSAFVKIILFDFDTYDKMNSCEAEMVQLSDCYPYNTMSYNLMEGGHNGRLSPESISKANVTKQKNGGCSGERNSMYGEKMLNHMTQTAYDEMRKKQIQNNKWNEMIQSLKNDPIRYEKWCKNISIGKTNVKLSNIHKQHIGMGVAKLKLHWWNNGILEVKTQKCPNGFKPGRLTKYWFNNGIVEILSTTCPTGFVQGRLKKNK